MLKTIKPEPDSQYRLLGCDCRSADVVYIQAKTMGKSKYRVKCLFCGRGTPWFGCRHDAQLDWNKRFRHD